ncbi:ES8L3 protein, partial [Grantiella picta]|nr:ES8L3 protein [Grantiella picta]
PSRGEYDDSSPLRHSNSFVRPTGKSIYNQRKDYGQTLLKLQSDFQHHVEHLVTMRLERELRSAEDCLGRLKGLEAQGRIWGQDVILEVKDQQLVLSDVESKVPPGRAPPKPGTLRLCDPTKPGTLRLCDPTKPGPPAAREHLKPGDPCQAETLRSSLEKVLKQRKEDQRNAYRHRYG